MTLRRITLQNFVIVESLDLELHGGFTVLTGETGAGKSILIDALQLLLGSRADAGMVRQGCTKADLSAEFDCPQHARPWLIESDIEVDDSLLLRRTIDSQGKSRAWINGTPVTATQLRALGDLLLDIHGQHAWQNLTKPDSVRSLLDAYAGIDIKPTALCWARWRADQLTLDAARITQDTWQQDRERLQWQIKDLSELAPGEGEWDELEAEHLRLSNSQSLLESAQGALLALEDDGASSSVLTGLTRAHALLQSQERFDPEFVDLAAILSSCIAQASDVTHSLQSYLRRSEEDPAHFAALDARIALWTSLSRRYKRHPRELPALLAGWREELIKLDATSDLDALTNAESESAKSYQAVASDLTRSRTRAATKLSRAITEAMQKLGMDGGTFTVRIEKTTEPTSSGVDSVAFLVSGHHKMEAKAIGKVASGGELSRIALAISVATSELGTAPTLIFDEVDSGIGGAVAESVGRLMRQLGTQRQVLAVTHLPQVAAHAHQHLRVTKHKHADTITSSVALLKGNRRTDEIARMLGGELLTETSHAHALEMLQAASPPTEKKY